MRIFPSSLLVPLLLGCTPTGVLSQERTCDDPQLGEKCNMCEPGSDAWTSDCTLMVRMKCTFIDKLTGKEESCFPPGDTINNNTPEPRWQYTRDECTRGGTNLEFEATIVYEMCNRNTDDFTPIPVKNFIKFADNRRLEAESIIEEDDWDNTIPAGECRTQIEKRTLKPCKNKWRGMALEMDGDLSRPWPKYCRCFLREYLLSEVSNNPAPKTPAPVPEPKTSPPVSGPPVSGPPVPAPKTSPPVPVPPKSDCDFTKVVITELASPDSSYAKYIELSFLDDNCKGATINVDLSVISYGPGDCDPSNIVIDLKGETVRDDGFLTICNSKTAENFYGRGECTVIGGLISPANLRGTETIAIVSEGDNKNVIDIFGIPCTDADPNNKQYFVNGRAVRKFSVWNPMTEYDYDMWHVFPGCGQEVGTEGMDINEWKAVVGPVCGPEATILITEIVDLDIDSFPVPRYVELYAPRKRHRGRAFNHNLKLVIFHSDSEEPHWASAVSIDYMPESGFLVICNNAANEEYGTECTATSSVIGGPADSNGNDQIALISGDKDGWFVVDIYGVIGEDGDDTDHDFLNSRVIRKLSVTDTVATWSKDDWVVCKSDIPDPNKWNNDKCGAEGTVKPTNSPTPKSAKDCEFFFTELSDVGHIPYIEIKTTCPPGQVIGRDLIVTSWKQYGMSCDVSLKGMKVPEDGMIIICANKNQHNVKYGGDFAKVGGKWIERGACDIEDQMLLAAHGYNSYAIMNNNSDCKKNDCVGSNCYSGCNDKYLDIYGYPGSSLAYTDHVYDACRVVRKIQYPYGIAPFNPNNWEIICLSFSVNVQPGEDADPGVWKEVPLVLFFTEFCDPQDKSNMRMIELYSPNKRNYNIDYDLIVMKWQGSNANPSSLFKNLKGHVVNSRGYLVLCVSTYGYAAGMCNYQTGTSSVANISGDEHFALAKCAYPGNDCTFIDTYGTPGIAARDRAQDFTNGKVFRRRTVPAPRKIFNVDHWVVVDNVNGAQCGAGTSPPPVPYPVEDPGSKPSKPTNGKPSSPSKGKGGKGGKGKYWRRK